MYTTISFILVQLTSWISVVAALRNKVRLAAALLALTPLFCLPALIIRETVFCTWIPFINAPIALYFDSASFLMILAALLAVVIPLLHAIAMGEEAVGAAVAALACYASISGLAFSWSLPVFYIFWELMLITSTILVLVYNRVEAIGYFAYMQAGSLLLLVGIAELLSRDATTFSYNIKASTLASTLIALSFAVKLGVMPFHTWLPRVYIRIPEHAAAILAGAITTAGAYGLYRFSHFVSVSVADTIFWIGIFSAALGALVALVSNELNRIAAYSSIAHSGFAFVGLLAGGYAAAGSLYMMVGHGVVKTLYFLVADVIRKVCGETRITRLGALMRSMPLTALAGFVAALSLAGAPVFALFPGELAAVVGTARTFGVSTAAALALAAFLSACYSMRYWLRVFWYPPLARAYRPPQEPPARRLAQLIPLLVSALVLGVIGGLVIPYLTT